MATESLQIKAGKKRLQSLCPVAQWLRAHFQADCTILNINTNTRLSNTARIQAVEAVQDF